MNCREFSDEQEFYDGLLQSPEDVRLPKEKVKHPENGRNYEC